MLVKSHIYNKYVSGFITLTTIFLLDLILFVLYENGF